MAPADFYISPTGNDSGSGSAAEPFATLARARDAVRGLKKSISARNITVEIAGGVYRLGETVVFGLDNSAPEGKRVIYKAAEGESPVFSAGKKVSGWVRVPAEKSPGEAPEAARGKLWRASYPNGVESVTSLFDGDSRITRARGASFPIDLQREKAEKLPARELRFPAGGLKSYSNLDSVELVIIPTRPWTMCILGIERIDIAEGIAIVDNDPVYPLAETSHGLVEQVWPENIFEALDGPGKYVSVNKERAIYLWPEGDDPGDDVVVPVLKELVRVEGEIDYDGPEDTPVEGIEFHGLTFTHGMRDTWDHDYAGTGVQHNWDFFDRGNAMVRLRGSERCVIKGCRIENSASGGIRLDLHCRDNTVSECEIAHVGGTGVLLQGYGPGTKDVNQRNSVVGNHIHYNGTDWWHSLAVFAWQSSHNLIAHNTIHHTGYTGIAVTGRIRFDRTGKAEASKSVRWDEIAVDTETEDTPEAVNDWWYRMEPYLHSRHNIIEKNDIYRVMERLGDGNAIYISGCGGGNIVRLNYIHDIFGTGSNAMIRTDDLQYETLIEKNLVFRCGGGGVVLKHKNDFVNNLLVDLGVEDPEGLYPAKPAFPGYIAVRRAPIDGTKVQRNIYVSNGGDVEILAEGASYLPSWGMSYLRDCDADNNLYYSADNPDWATEFLEEKQAEGVERHSVQADPRITGAYPDFHITEDSPAAKLGFEPFDLSDVGSPLVRRK